MPPAKLPPTDLPIIFQGSMVRAMLAGDKTDTRRLPKVQPVLFDVEPGVPCSVGLHYDQDDLRPRVTLYGGGGGGVVTTDRLRWGPGMKLWVKENFAYVGGSDPGFLTFQATYPNDLPRHVENVPAEFPGKWHPSIHMPRRLSRLTLTVTKVRLERLHDISEADARAEGIIAGPHDGWWVGGDPVLSGHSAIGAYMRLWGKINGAESWAANPFVVALTFEVGKHNIDGAAA